MPPFSSSKDEASGGVEGLNSSLATVPRFRPSAPGPTFWGVGSYAPKAAVSRKANSRLSPEAVVARCRIMGGPLASVTRGLNKNCSLRYWCGTCDTGFHHKPTQTRPQAPIEAGLSVYFFVAHFQKPLVTPKGSTAATSFSPCGSRSYNQVENSPARAITPLSAVGIWRRAWLAELVLRPRRWSALIRF